MLVRGWIVRMVSGECTLRNDKEFIGYMSGLRHGNEYYKELEPK